MYIYQHFQDSEKIHQIEPENDLSITDDDSLYPYVNNDIEYGLFEDIVDNYYLDSQIKDDFQCDQDCSSQYRDLTNDDHPNICTHDYHHITQNIQDLTDNIQQNNLHSMEECTSSFTDDTESHNSRVHNQKKESELTNADRGEIFKSDVDVELDNNKHVDDDFKFKIFVAKELKNIS